MKKFLILLFVMFICQQAYGVEEVQKISLKEALKIAVENNIDYKASKINIDIDENKVRISNKLKNPELNTFFNIGKIGTGNPQTIGASETIEIAKRDARKKLAQANLELTKQNLEYIEFDLKMDVREAYVNLVAAKEILIALEERRKLLNDLLAIAKKRVADGEVEEIDVIQAEISLDQLVIQVNSQKANVKAAMFDFNKVMNVQNGIKYDAEDENFSDKEDFLALLSPEPLDKLPEFNSILQNSIKNRYDIKIALKEIDVAQKNLTYTEHLRIPDLELFGGYGFMTNAMSESGSSTHGAYAGANVVNIPLFCAYQPEIKNARMQLEQAQLKYNSVENKALNDLQSSYEKFVTAQVNLNYYNDNLLKNSKEMIKAAKKNYANGKSGLTTLIVMEQSYRSINAGYIYALADYYRCWINFLREVNVEHFDLNKESL